MLGRWFALGTKWSIRRMNQPIAINTPNMLPTATNKTVKLPAAMTFTGKKVRG